jgi:murein DD-endopeptidase MepM/ murein hydrolase activator NlpD
MRKKRVQDRNRGMISAAVFCLLASLCAYSGTAAAAGQIPWPQPSFYTVVTRPGDTIDSIGARYRTSASVIAKLNGLDARSRIPPGRVLRIPAGGRATRSAVLSEAMDRQARNYAPAPNPPRTNYSSRLLAPPKAPAPPSDSGIVQVRTRAALRFAWPISGPVISSFGPDLHGERNDGINIAAERGLPFRAAANGRISYAGPLKGYGNLIIITHPDGYVTAYAHADNIAVSPGEEVTKGQVIGTAGDTGGVDRPQLHFEIRRGVRPIDPAHFFAANS